MEQKKAEAKLLDMVMCGDHSSINKAELNVKDSKCEVKERDREKTRFPMSFPRVSPTTSRTEQPERIRNIASEQALRLYETKRRGKSHELKSEVIELRADVTSPTNRALMQSALGSIRWPPYLVMLWVVALVCTHLLHCVVNMLDKMLPNLRAICQYFRTWTEDSWRSQKENRAYSIALASVTGLLYAIYCALTMLQSLLLWAAEPLCGDEDAEQEACVTNYEEIKT